MEFSERLREKLRQIFGLRERDWDVDCGILCVSEREILALRERLGHGLLNVVYVYERERERFWN